MRKRWIFLAMIVSMYIAYAWNKFPIISNTAHKALDPSLGALLNIDIFGGFLIIIFLLALATTFVQKYTTDQKALKEIKEEQKKMQAEMKKFEKSPEKIVELNQKQFELMGRMMKISMGSVVYTAVPFILLFRWFNDFFLINPYKFFGFMTWFLFYLLGTLLFSSIIRKVMKVE